MIGGALNRDPSTRDTRCLDAAAQVGVTRAEMPEPCAKIAASTRLSDYSR